MKPKAAANFRTVITFIMVISFVVTNLGIPATTVHAQDVATETPTVEPIATDEPTATESPVATDAPTEEVTPTETATLEPTMTPTETATETPTETATETEVSTQSDEDATILSLPVGYSVGSINVVNPYFSTQDIVAPDGKSYVRYMIHGPSEPINPELEKASLVTESSSTGVILGWDFPAYSWVLGCTAVSASMIAAYYDQMGLSNIYTGPTNSGVMPNTEDPSWGYWTDSSGEQYPNNPLIASHNGLDGRTTAGTIDDYWLQFGSTAADPFITNQQTQHSWGNAIGDYMKTSQSLYGNTDGNSSNIFYNQAGALNCSDMSSSISTIDATYGQKLFYESKGYTVSQCFNQLTDNQITGGFSFNDFKNEINNLHPVIIQLDGHSMVGIGYYGDNQIYIHNTWDNGTHLMTWGSSYDGMEMVGVSVVALDFPYPTVPTLSSPSGTISTTKPTLIWTAVKNATQYQYQIYNGSSLVQSNTYSGSCGVTCASTLSTALSTGISYKWRVRAYVNSTWQSYSDYQNFTISLVPVLLAPSGTVKSPDPIFSWKATSGATSYAFKLINTDTSATVINGTLTPGDSTNPVVSVDADLSLSNHTNYSFQVASITSSGTGTYSSAMTFYTDLSPVTPVLIAPRGTIREAKPTYQWNVVTSATSYQLKVIKTGTTTTVINQTVAPTACTSGVCSVTPTTALSNAVNYSYTVTAINSYGSTVSAANSISTDLAPNEIPELIGPEGRIKTLTPTFQWYPVSVSITGYKLIIENASTGDIVTTKSISTTACTGSPTKCSYVLTTPLTNGLNYDFTVEAVNTYGAGCGEYLQFKPDLTLDPPTLGNPSGIISTRKPTFTWNPVSGATGYELKITNTDTDTVTQDISVATSYCPSGTCSYPLSSALTDVNGTNYSFTVATKNSYGPGTFATPVAFQLGIIPGPTTMVYPIGDIDTHNIVFKWNGVADATYYILQVTNTDTSSTSTLSFGVSCTSGICSAPATMIEQGNNYSVIIAAQNDFGQSAFSTPVTYHITVPYLPTPNLLSPVGTSASLKPAFRWGEVEEATNYKLIVTDSNSSEIINSTFDTSICANEICQFIPTATLTEGATYHISLQSIKGSYFGTVVTSSFVAYNSTTPPTLIGPSGTISDDNPKFSWNNNGTGGNYYHILVTDTDKGSVVIDGSLFATYCAFSGVCNYIPTTALTGQHYKFEVATALSNDTYGTLSSPMYFNYTNHIPPTVPTLVSPSGSISADQPTFTWNVVSGATGYKVKVTNTDTSSVDINQTLDSSTVCPGSICSYTATSPLNGQNYSFTVSSINLYGTSSESTPLTFYYPNHVKPDVPVAGSPSGEVSTELPTFSWTASTLAASYTVKVTNTDTSVVAYSQDVSSSAACSGSNCSLTPTTALYGQNYQFTVSATNIYGTSAESTPVTFYYTTHHAPDAPVLTAPSGKIYVEKPTFTWNKSDLATSYQLKVTDTKTSVTAINQTIEATSSYCSGSSCSYPSSVTLTGLNYKFEVQAINRYGNSAFSDPTTFIIGLHEPPVAPTLTSPSGLISADAPTFVWNASTYATSYHLQVTNTDTNSVEIDKPITNPTCPGGVCTYSPAITLYHQNYSFAVSAINAYGTGDYSTPMTFYYTTHVAPDVPVAGSPSGEVSTELPTFTWTAANLAASYTLKVTNTDTSEVAYSQNVTSSAACSGSSCSIKPTTALYAQNYQFTVSATNIYGTSAESTPVAFYYTTHIPPAKPEATSPSGEISADKPTFTWKAADLATGYKIKVTNSDTSTNDITQTLTSSVCTGQTCTWTATSALMGQNYEFTITGTNRYGDGPESDPVTFYYTTHHAPVAPELTAPSGKIYVEKPTFTWNTSDLATSYQLKVTDTKTSVAAINQTVSATSSYCNGSSCAYPSSVTLTGLNYKFEVQAINLYGNSSFSEPTTFIIGLHEAPAVPTLVSPSGDNYVEYPTFKWNAVSYATGYTLKVTNTDTSTTAFTPINVSTSVCASGVCSYKPTTNLSGLNYKFEVLASNNYGSSNYSDPMVFAMAAHQAPKTAPTLVGPTGETTDETPTFQWNAVDGATNYQLTVTSTDGTTTYLDKNVLSSVCSSGVCSYTTSAPLLGIYYQFKVQARNTYGNGDYSEPMAFTYYIHFPPDVPTAVSPSGEIVVSRPTYTWNAVAGATSYLLKVTDTDTNTITVTDTVSASACSSGVCSDTPAVSLHGKNYEFAVAAKNAYGQSEYSTALTIIQQLPTPPSFKDLPGNIVDSTPTVQWNAVADATSYQFRILDDKENYIVLDETVPAEDCTDGICEFTPDKEMNDGYYYFEVASINGYGQSDYTAVSVSQNMPIAPTPLSPSGTIYDLKPVIKWKASIGATTYKLTITNTDTSVVSTIAVPSTVCKMNLCSYTPTIVWNDGNYEFTLTASSNFANSENPASSTPMEFTYAYHQVPAVPEGISPSGETVYVQKPIYTWKSVLRATGYVLKVTNNDTGVVSVNNVSVATSACKNGTCAFTPSVSLTTLPNGNYSFVVAAKNANGVSGYSEPVTFDYSYQTVPDAPEVISFTDTVYAQKPVYKWNVPAGSAPTGYYFRLTNVDTNKVVSNNVLVSASACKNSICSYTPSVTPTTMPAGNYVFEVSAKNNFGQSDYTASDQFEYLFQTAPNAPDVNSFTDTVYAQKPVYTWNVPSNGSAPTGYYFRLTNVDTNKVVVNNVLVSVSACKNLICSYTPAVTPLTMPAGNYVFEVSAKNNYGQSDYTASDQFEYLFQTAPDAPEVNAFDGTVYVQKPVYTWKVPSSGSAPTGYYFRLTNVDTDKVVINSALVSVSACKNMICSYTPSVTPTTMLAGNYVFEVSAKNNYGQSDYTASDQFEYLFPTAPNAPDLISPTEMSYLARPTYTWNVPSTGSVPTGYLFKLTNLDSGKVVFNGVSVSTSACKNLICTYSPSVTAITMPDGNYEFAVAARNSFGSSDYSTAVSFIKDTSIPPAAPSLIGPTGTTNLETFPFSWYPSEGATGYVLNVTNTDSNQVVVSNLAVASKYCVKGVCSFTPAVNFANANYKFTVASTNLNGTGSASDETTFTVFGFNSQFTKNSFGWSLGDYSYWKVSGGSLVTSGSMGKKTIFQPQNYADFDYSARVKRTGGIYQLFAGYNYAPATSLFVRASVGKSTTTGYEFAYYDMTKTGNSYYVIWKHKTDGTVALVQAAETNAITAQNWNTLRVTASGNEFNFYINGQLMYTLNDSDFSSGLVGLSTGYNWSMTTTTMSVDWATLSEYSESDPSGTISPQQSKYNSAANSQQIVTDNSLQP